MKSNEGGVVAAVLGVPKVVQEGFREPALGKAVMSHTQTTRCASQVYVSRDTTTTLVHRGEGLVGSLIIIIIVSLTTNCIVAMSRIVLFGVGVGGTVDLGSLVGYH